ncbi:tetratricopeptide repeat protein [Leeia aquatica]|uniref:Sel1 repeat family protein n=1 Tax=Leeia aquatica TaxID=2725557 RepID=A0A847S8R4_9NEIS|nr:SEL1-like repeat protein [Leeia aquatica]NLR73996.1 sel1 repeat family protein [Leeia aquatica]
MDDLKAHEVIRRAEDLIEAGGCQAAYDLLLPLLAEGRPEAMFLYAQFSISRLETDDEFELRSFKLLQQASERGYAPATYALGVCFEMGDLVEQDIIRASGLYKSASDSGYPKAKLTHGLNLFYGSLGVPKDEAQGLALVKQAIAEGVEGAAEALDLIKAAGQGRT